MKVDLLLRLADLLEADAANPNGVCFDLSDWSHPMSADLKASNDDETWARDMDVIPVNCNTAACAVGLAAISGAFEAEGLRWKIEPTFGDESRLRGFLVPFVEGQPHMVGFHAAKVVFDLTDVEVFSLFDPDHYAYEKRKGAESEREVARRIRALVAGAFQPVESPYINREVEY